MFEVQTAFEKRKTPVILKLNLAAISTTQVPHFVDETLQKSH